MDKIDNIATTRKSRKGFALIITLSVLSVVIALTVVLLSYFSKVKEDAETTKALIQADIYYADIISRLKTVKDKKTLYGVYPPIHTPDGRFNILLQCRPIATGVNINWLAMEQENGKKQYFQEAQRFFDTLAQQYNIEDASRLLEMILKEIGIGKKYVQESQSRLIQKNGIISYRQFSEIIKRYEMEVDDTKIGHVPWRKYFSFANDVDKIDADYSSAELIALLFDIDIQTVQEWKSLRDRPPLKTFLMENGVDYASKSKLLAGNAFLGESRCSVSYGDGYKFTFDYIKEEAKYFEFHGKH